MPHKKPMNDVTDHYGKHVGMPMEKVEMHKLPKPIRYFGYVALSFMGGSAVLIAILLIVQRFI